jgi:hypothetical protein
MPKKPTDRPPAATTGSGGPANRPASRWEALYGRAILQAGIAALPRALYLYQASLGLTAQEIWFISAILAHKWDADLPYPNLRTMATQSGMTLRQLKRIRAGLEEKGALQVHPRYDATGRQEANSYDFTRLFAQLESAIMADPPGDNGLQADAVMPLVAPGSGAAMSFVARFGRVIVRAGIAAIPQALFTYQEPLGLSPQQIWFIAYILAHRWSTELPYPSLRRMAERTGYSERHLHTIKDELVAAGYLILVERHLESGGRDNNGYDFSNLLQALNAQLQRTASPDSNAPPTESNPPHTIAVGASMEGDTQFSAGGGHIDHMGGGQDDHVGGGRVVHIGGGRTDHRLGGHTVQSGGGRVIHRTGASGAAGRETFHSAGRGTSSSDEIESSQEEPDQEERIGSAPAHSQGIHPRKTGAQSYLERLIADITRELEHPLRRTPDEQALEARSNVERALRLWEDSGLAVDEFADLVQDARRRTQEAKGKQGLRRLARPMAYFFRVLERCLNADSAAAQPPGNGAEARRQQPARTFGRTDDRGQAGVHRPLDPDKYLRGKYAHLFRRSPESESS